MPKVSTNLGPILSIARDTEHQTLLENVFIYSNNSVMYTYILHNLLDTRSVYTIAKIRF